MTDPEKTDLPEDKDGGVLDVDSVVLNRTAFNLDAVSARFHEILPQVIERQEESDDVHAQE